MSRQMKTLVVATLVAVLASPVAAAAEEKKKSLWSKVGFVSGLVIASVVAGAVCVGTGPLCAAGITVAATGAASGAGALVDKATGRDWEVEVGTGPIPIGKIPPVAPSPPEETPASEVMTETGEVEEVADSRSETQQEDQNADPPAPVPHSGSETQQQGAPARADTLEWRMGKLDEAASVDKRTLDARRMDSYQERLDEWKSQHQYWFRPPPPEPLSPRPLPCDNPRGCIDVPRPEWQRWGEEMRENNWRNYHIMELIKEPLPRLRRGRVLPLPPPAYKHLPVGDR